MKSLILKYSFICYALISIGLIWLYSLSLRENGLYERVTLNTNEWIFSHIVLLIGAILVFPATMILIDYLKEENGLLVKIAVALTLIGAASLIGQYILDFCLVSLFKDKTSSVSYESLDQIRNRGIVKFLFYELVAVWFLGQTLFAIILLKTKKYPKWALSLFIVGLLMLLVGASFHELLERLSYLLISSALLPMFNELTISKK